MTEPTSARRELTGPELEIIRSRLCAAASQMAAAQCWWLDLVAECDETSAWFGYGIRDCAHWISYSCSMSIGTAREHVRVARALRNLPLIHAAFAAGGLSYTKVREATRIADRIDEETLLSLAQTCTATQFERTVRGFRRSDADRMEQEKRRKVKWYVDTDGSVVFCGRLPAEEGDEFVNALNAMTDDLNARQRAALRETAAEAEPAAGDPAPREDVCEPFFADLDPEGRHRPRQRAAIKPIEPTVDRADALLEMARRALHSAPSDESGEDRHLVVVHIDAELLADADPGAAPTARSTELDRSAVPAEKCCQVQGIGGIAPNTAARLSCDATVVAMIRGRGGRVLAHGRSRRLVSEQQRRVLMVRDGACQFPGCHRTHHLQAHHVIPWSKQGRTDLDNLILVCRLHHVAVHEGGYRLDRRPGEPGANPDFTFVDPAGNPVLRLPFDDVDYPTSFPLSRDLDHITRWTQSEVERIRPRWAGERVCLPDLVAALLDNPKEKEAA